MPKLFLYRELATPVIHVSPNLSLNEAQRAAYTQLGIQPIASADITATIAALCEHAAYHLPADYIAALTWAYRSEPDGPAKKAMRQLLINHLAASAAKQPTCQDTGQTVVILEIGQDARVIGDLNTAVNEGVRQGYKNLRKSVVLDAVFDRRNTGDNTPAVIHTKSVPGNQIKIHIFEKGYGSENKSMGTTFLLPNDDPEKMMEAVVAQAVKHLVGEKDASGKIVKKGLGGDWCPPGVFSIAVGGDLVSCAEHAKAGLADAYDMPALLERRASGDELTANEKFRVRLFEALNNTGVGAQGLGGKKTVLDVKLWTGSTHLAGCPVAISVQCSKPAHAGAVLDGSGPVSEFDIPDYAAIAGNLDAEPGAEPIHIEMPLTAEKIKGLKAGDEVLITGCIYTARDAAHQRLVAMLAAGEALPVPLQGQMIFYVGPIKDKSGKIIAAGPTTASRMDPYTPQLLDAGLSGIIGKGERGSAVVDAIKSNQAVYFIAVGGAAHTQAKAIIGCEAIAFADLGPEAILVYDVVDFPVVVAIDSEGNNLHEAGRLKFVVKTPS